MSDMELAEEIERQTKDRDAADIVLELDRWQQIIAALRRRPAGSAASPPITAESHEFTEQEQRRFDLEAAQALLPEGYVILRQPSDEMVMVPRELTPAMHEAGLRFAGTLHANYEDCWKALLSAAEAEGRK